MRRWITQDGAQASLTVLPLPHRPGDLRAAVAHLRRGLRDVRDRAAKRRAPWSGVALAGMAAGDGAYVLVNHPAVDRAEISEALRGRWPGSAVSDAGAPGPSWTIAAEDAAELARARRGVEPLRIVVLAQRAADAGAFYGAAQHDRPPPIEPMPIVL